MQQQKDQIERLHRALGEKDAAMAAALLEKDAALVEKDATMALALAEKDAAIEELRRQLARKSTT